MNSDSKLQTDERKNMKTTPGDICKVCSSLKIVPNKIILQSSILREFPQLEYTDTQKNAHVHNMDVIINTYVCNKGHTWTTNISMNKCWCISVQESVHSGFGYLRNSPMVSLK